ncbi:hypothetical protein JMJ76_0002895, partial [Colletotrichum scovillei]
AETLNHLDWTAKGSEDHARPTASSSSVLHVVNFCPARAWGEMLTTPASRWTSCSTASHTKAGPSQYCEPARSTYNRESGISTWLPDRRINLRAKLPPHEVLSAHSSTISAQFYVAYQPPTQV